MRPLSLRVQGLTSYRRPIEVDFRGLDLFAITGPTGAGKSSIVDAITFALYGEVPRVGNSVKQVISLGEERLKVELEFEAGGTRYRVHRQTARKGQAPPQLERFDPARDEWVPEEDRAGGVTGYVTRVLGMDYDGFVRSVLLPQGEFQKFLSGRPEERRKVLDGLLRLHVYQRMMERANEIARRHEDEAERIGELLRTEYADATPENLKAAKARLQSLREKSRDLGAMRDALDAARALGDRLKAAREREKRAAAELQRAEGELKQAQESAANAGRELEALERRLGETEKALADNRYDAELHNRLSKGLVLLEQAEKMTARAARLREEARARVEEAERAGAAVECSRRDEEAAAGELERAQAVLDELRRREVAAGLRRALKAGDTCPVCEQVVAVVPGVEHPALQEAEEALRTAKAASEAASAAARRAETAAELAAQAALTAQEQLSRSEADRDAAVKSFRQTLPGRDPDRQVLQAEEEEQQRSRKERLRLDGEIRELGKRREQLRQALEPAKLARLEAEATGLRREIESVKGEVTEAQAQLHGQAKDHGWDDALDALSTGQDALPVLKSRLAQVQDQIGSVNRDIGAWEKDVERLEAGIARVGDLREKEKAEREAGRLAKDLGTLLRADRFQAFVREQALHVLAQDGSRQLHELSRGRYDFAVEGQEFFIVDHWNAGESRSVRTLSGGETFLASLALAVALAERLPQLSAGGEGAALESLFIDEGFSYLDEETLDVVATALEVLGGNKNRLIGVVTHVPALAERMPARITVHKAAGGSTISVE